MHQDAVSEARIAGAILGRLFPPLDLAADELYERVNAGERVDGAHVPSSLGFETGVLDHVLVEAFKACVPAVKTFLVAGGMILIAGWTHHRGAVADSRNAAEQRKLIEAELQRRIQELESARREQQAVRESFERLVELFLRHGTVSSRQLAESKIVQIITQVPERTSGNEEDDEETSDRTA